MSFFKHVGTVNSKKVIIVQRQLNGDDEHMAVVIYSSIMPAKYHDDVMKLLESPEGQAAFEFRDILERRMMADGQNMLQALSHENYLKRVPAANVMVTPNSKSSMRLDELTKLLNKVGRGDEAVKQLDRMENSQGYADPAKAALTDSQVAESVSLADMGIDVAAENAKLSAPVAAAPAPIDQTALMMQMMQTMQAMQQQISEMRGDASPAPKAKAAAPKVAKTKTAKTVTRV
jgi:hypothetical protein